MNYIYDVVLNFFGLDNYCEFYEWDKNDKFFYVDRIPIYKINRFQMNDLLNNKVKFNNSFLELIHNKTQVDGEKIPYCILVTDSFKVIGLNIDNTGVLIEKSSLLLDEEEAVIEESNEFDMELLDYKIISEINNNLFLTRRDKKIQKILLEEISNLFFNKEYDEINYLYNELYFDDCSIDNKYNILINNIKNNYDSKNSNILYNIIKLSNSIMKV